MVDKYLQSVKKYIFWVLLIGLGFLWTGTAYIAQAYRLLSLMDAGTVSRITCGSYYLCQAAGICLVALFFAKRPAFAGGRVFPFCSTIFALGCTAVSLYISSLTAVIISGFLLNIAIGVLSGCYLTRLSTNIPQQRRGVVFGFAYALGSIGTWLISLPMGGRFLWHRESFFAITALAALTLPFMLRLSVLPVRERISGHPQKGFDLSLIILAGAVLFLLSMENTLGFSFPLKGASDSLYIEFARIFYGVGLVIAGFVSDKNRRYGAICCLAALAFPFAALAHGNNEAGETLMWVLAYLFLGFFSVYRTLLFSDISGKTGIPAFAVLGLMFGRLGEAAGTMGAGFFSGTPLIIISGAVFVLVILLFFVLYQKLYASVVSPEESEQQRFTAYSVRFGFSAREQEIFALIIRGMSNAEIAAELYITESTVKFHIGNMFKKSGFARRSELITDYKLGNSN